VDRATRVAAMYTASPLGAFRGPLPSLGSSIRLQQGVRWDETATPNPLHRDVRWGDMATPGNSMNPAEFSIARPVASTPKGLIAGGVTPLHRDVRWGDMASPGSSTALSAFRMPVPITTSDDTASKPLTQTLESPVEVKARVGLHLLDSALNPEALSAAVPYVVRNTFVDVDVDEKEDLGAGAKTMPVMRMRRSEASLAQPAKLLDLVVVPEAQDNQQGIGIVPLAGRKPTESVGCTQHGTGRCKPCAWYWREQGCANGRQCMHCHLCPEGELKDRKKAKIARMRAGHTQGS